MSAMAFATDVPVSVEGIQSLLQSRPMMGRCVSFLSVMERDRSVRTQAPPSEIRQDVDVLDGTRKLLILVHYAYAA